MSAKASARRVSVLRSNAKNFMLIKISGGGGRLVTF